MSFSFEDEENQCLICLEPIIEKAACMSCKSNPIKHIFHCDCIDKWSQNKNKCPVCRGTLESIKGIDDRNHVWYMSGLDIKTISTMEEDESKRMVNNALFEAIYNLDMTSVKILVENYKADVNVLDYKLSFPKKIYNDQKVALPPLQFLIQITFETHIKKLFEEEEILEEFVELREYIDTLYTDDMLLVQFRMKEYNPDRPVYGYWFRDKFKRLRKILDHCARMISSRQQIAEFLLHHGANPDWVQSVDEMILWGLSFGEYLQPSIIQSILWYDQDMVELLMAYKANFESRFDTDLEQHLRNRFYEMYNGTPSDDLRITFKNIGLFRPPSTLPLPLGNWEDAFSYVETNHTTISDLKHLSATPFYDTKTMENIKAKFRLKELYYTKKQRIF